MLETAASIELSASWHSSSVGVVSTGVAASAAVRRRTGERQSGQCVTFGAQSTQSAWPQPNGSASSIDVSRHTAHSFCLIDALAIGQPLFGAGLEVNQVDPAPLKPQHEGRRLLR